MAASARVPTGTADRGSSGYASYHNDRWHFSLAAPADMKVEAVDYPGGGQEFSFANTSGTELFTVAAVPYSQLDLTLDNEGAPSGAGDQPDHLEIVNVQRDDVFKVWFTKNGTLYVIVTMPERESWLRGILKTWQFN